MNLDHEDYYHDIIEDTIYESAESDSMCEHCDYEMSECPNKSLDYLLVFQPNVRSRIDRMSISSHDTVRIGGLHWLTSFHRSFFIFFWPSEGVERCDRYLLFSKFFFPFLNFVG